MKDKTIAPLILSIRNELNELRLKKYHFKPIEKNVIWLWGETPKSPCGGVSYLHLRFLYDHRLYKDFGGLFAWKIKIKDLPQDRSFYIQPQLNIKKIKDIKAEASQEASQNAHFRCKIEKSGTCNFLFSIRKDFRNKKSEIIFTENFFKNSSYACPT